MADFAVHHEGLPEGSARWALHVDAVNDRASHVYVDGDVHTNTIEGFWALMKNGIRGVYHAVSEKHLQSYANEYAFRYNHRDDAQAMFTTVGNRVQNVRDGQYGDYQPLG